MKAIEFESAINLWNKANQAQIEASDKILALFLPLVHEKLSQGDFKGAKETCRPIPIDCVAKVLLFREILVAESKKDIKPVDFQT